MKIEVLEMTFPGEGDVALINAREDDGAIVGTVCVKRGGPMVGEFARLFVVETQRRRGIGRALLEHAAGVAGKAGCVALSCSVNPKNVRARLFYTRLGFKPAFHFGDGDILLTLAIHPRAVVQSVQRCDRCDPSFTCWAAPESCRHPEAKYANTSASFCAGGES